MVESFVIPVLVAFGLVVALRVVRGRSDCRCLVPIFLCVGADSF